MVLSALVITGTTRCHPRKHFFQLLYNWLSKSQSTCRLLSKVTMPATTRTNLNSGPRRSPRLKNIHIIYDEDSNWGSSTFKPVKTEVTALEEIASPSTSELNVASVSDKDCERDFHNVSLKDLRAWCKARNQKASKLTSERSGINNRSEKTQEEFDLDKPLISLKQKRQKTSPGKANGKMDALTFSPCSMKVQNTTLKRGKTHGPTQITPLEATARDLVTEKLGREATHLEHSKITIDRTDEIVGEHILHGEVENTAEALVSRGNPDVLCEIKTEDIDYAEEFGTSRCSKKSFYESSSFELQQEPLEGDECTPQPCFMKPTELADISNHSFELTSSVKEYILDDIVAQKASNVVSSLGFIDEVSNHEKKLENIANSGMNRSSIGNGLLVCSVNQSCYDCIDNNEYWNTGVVQGNGPESAKILDELSPIDESNSDMVPPLVAIQSDLYGRTEMNCTSLEEVVQMRVEGQLDSIICCDVRSKQMLLDMGIEHAATDCTFDFDKTLDLVQPANFVAQDGRLESIVYDDLNNHAQRMISENNPSVGLPGTAVIQSPVIDFPDNSSDEKKASDDGKTLLPSNVEWSLNDMDKPKSTFDYDICKSVDDEEELVPQPQLFQACADKESTSSVTSEISIAKETQEMSAAGVPNSCATSLETDGQINKSGLFIDEESIEEHAPRKLLSKRKIMSPTSQEKLCNALTGIDLCGVQRQKRKIIPEDCDKNRISLPQPAHKQDRSMFSTDKRLKGRASVSPTSKGVLKSTESPSHQQAICSCMRSSSVILDTEKAVEFSQRQMHDIENIAAKLIRSLKHMKSIVDESLSSEAYSSVANFNTAEVRAASDDALEVEKTTRKWLAIMNKDCNRFCKILTLARKNAVSHPEAPRKQRKVIFADEAGGKLCHVKVFKDGHTSLLSECQSDL